MHGGRRGPPVPVRVSHHEPLDGAGDGPGAQLAAVFRAEHGRVVASLARRFGDLDLAEDATGEALVVAAERWPVEGVPPNPGGWLTTVAGNKALDRIRREKRRQDKYAEVSRMDINDDPDRAHRPGRGRPAAAAVHLLPPRPRAGEPRGSHPAAARRADRGGDRRRLLRPRDDDGAADHPLEAEDQGRQHPLPDPAGRRRAGADEWCPRRPLPGLQRGLPGVLWRGASHRPDHRGDPAHPAAARDARRHPVAGPPAGGRRAAGADAAGGLTQGGPRARRRAGRPRRAGPHAVGRRDDRRGPPARTALPVAEPAGALPAAGCDQRRAHRCARRIDDRLDPGAAALRPAARDDARARWWR